MKRTLLHTLFHTVTVLSNINVRMQLQNIKTPLALETSQTCTTLAPGQCCVPLDISEESLTSDRNRYQVTLLQVRTDASRTTHDIEIFAHESSASPCEGALAAEFRVQSTGRGRVFRPFEGLRVSGVTIDGSSETELLYPSVISYKGGLYYEYLTGSLTYVKVSHPGEGPNVIYGMDQRLGTSTSLWNRTVHNDGVVY